MRGAGARSFPQRENQQQKAPRFDRSPAEAASDSRTFSRETTGIRLGSSQNVNVVLFSLACRKVSTLYKYFVLSHLHPGG
jgi:hypothetical protein